MVFASFPGTLASLFVTVLLVPYEGIRKKKTCAMDMGTPDLSGHGLAPRETANLL